MKYIFGPVNSRRLGRSLGIDPLPSKFCTLDCVYCEVGGSTTQTCERKEYAPLSEIVAEIDEFFSKPGAVENIDVVTITGSGEPTLHSGIGTIIGHLKKVAGKPVVVLTNGTLLHLPEVRQELMAADIVIPSLDAADTRGFRRVNRPAPCIDLKDVIKGIATFCREFAGEVWLEVLLVSGMNDSPGDIEALIREIRAINPDRVQLNTVARPPLESFARPLEGRRLQEIAAEIQENCDRKVDLLVSFQGKDVAAVSAPESEELDERIFRMLKRRPCTENDMCEALALHPEVVTDVVARLLGSGRINKMTHNGKIYYQV